MLSTYSALLRKPGAAAFAAAGFISRFPISMSGIGLLFMVELQYDSYAMAGRVTGFSAVMWALQTVPTARLVDRIGQRAAMWPLTGLFVLGTTVSIATAMQHGPEPWLWVGAGLASFSGPLGSLTRARWSYLLKDNDDEIHTAFALEGVLDEILFICGPAVVGLLATEVHPAGGLVVCSVGMVVGIAYLLRQTETEPPPTRGTDAPALGLRVPKPIIAAAIGGLTIGLAFGAADVAVLGFTEDQGHQGMAGVVLGCISLGSFIAGMIYGSRKWRAPLWQRIVFSSVAFATLFSVLMSMPNLVWFSLVGFVAGATISPYMTSIDNLIQRSVPSAQLTEGMAWLRVGIGIGVAGGAAVAGALIDSFGVRTAMFTAAGAAVLFALSMLATIPWMRGVRGNVVAEDVHIEMPPGSPAAH